MDDLRSRARAVVRLFDLAVRKRRLALFALDHLFPVFFHPSLLIVSFCNTCVGLQFTLLIRVSAAKNSRERRGKGTRLGVGAFSQPKSIEKIRCKMKQLALALALTGSCVFATTIASTPASALETYEAQMEASDAASQARVDMIDAFG